MYVTKNLLLIGFLFAGTAGLDGDLRDNFKERSASSDFRGGLVSASTEIKTETCAKAKNEAVSAEARLRSVDTGNAARIGNSSAAFGPNVSIGRPGGAKAKNEAVSAEAGLRSVDTGNAARIGNSSAAFRPNVSIGRPGGAKAKNEAVSAEARLRSVDTGNAARIGNSSAAFGPNVSIGGPGGAKASGLGEDSPTVEGFNDNLTAVHTSASRALWPVYRVEILPIDNNEHIQTRGGRLPHEQVTRNGMSAGPKKKSKVKKQRRLLDDVTLSSEPVAEQNSYMRRGQGKSVPAKLETLNRAKKAHFG